MEIFLVEDSPPIRVRLAEMLAAIPGTNLVGVAERADTAIRDILAKRPDVVVLDLSLAGGTSGFEVLRGVCREAPEIDFYMLSNFAADRTASSPGTGARFLRQAGIRTRSANHHQARRRRALREPDRKPPSSPSDQGSSPCPRNSK
jgi:chemotaxis response regulator CheB